MKTRSLICTLALIICVGCSPKVRAPEGDPTGDGLPRSPLTATEAVIEFGIGDVETSILIVLTMDESQESESVQYEEVETKKYEIAIVQTNIVKPYPEKLMLAVKIRTFDAFEEHAVQVKPRIFFGEDKVVDLEGFIFGGDAGRARRQISVDLFEHVQDIPESMLLRVETELNLFMDAGKSGITPETPLTPETRSVIKLSNPMRINFLP